MRGYLGSERHSFPRAIAAFCCTVVLLASPAAWRRSTRTISVPSRLLAVPSNSRQWAKHRAAFPDTISSQLEPNKWRKMDSSVWNNKGIANSNITLKYIKTHDVKFYRYTALQIYCTLLARMYPHTDTCSVSILGQTLKCNSWPIERACKCNNENMSIISHFYRTSEAPPVPADWQQCTQSES